MAFLKKHSMQQISSIPSHQADSPRSTGVLTLGSFHNPHGSSSQLPWTPVDLQPCPRYERLQHGLSMWFSLYSDCHRSPASPSDSLRCFPSIPTNYIRCRNLSPPPAPQHLSTGLVLLAFLLFLPSFSHPTQLCIDSYNPFQWSGTPASSKLMLCKICI